MSFVMEKQINEEEKFMITFLISLVVLVVGFALYSRLIERVFRVDDRQTPAVAHPDGVDYTPMKTWRLFLIQLLNIAGLGPIFGALAGACWGPRVYLWIVFGTILGGGVHDFLSGMMSERHDGASISEIVGIYLGKFMLQVMRVFSVVLLILVGVNFSKNPAQLLAILTPETLDANFWLAVVLIYYFIATFLPIDKVIGKLYPIFGACLIIMALGLMGVMLIDPSYRAAMPEMWQYIGVEGMGHPTNTPIWAQMFVTVACGAISGFHATQSPMVARCMTSEKEGRKVFYGAMVAEGAIALVWAAAGVTFYQGNWKNRLLLSVPVLGIGALITQWGDFATLWKYFSWSNQTLAMMVLWAGAVYLHRNGFPPVACFMAALPATFMSAVSVTYFVQAPECLNMSTTLAYPLGILVAALFLGIFIWREWVMRKNDVLNPATV